MMLQIEACIVYVGLQCSYSWQSFQWNTLHIPQAMKSQLEICRHVATDTDFIDEREQNSVRSNHSLKFISLYFTAT